MEYQDMLHRCFRCGWCKLPTNFSDINCPAYLKHRFESFALGGRLWLIRAWLEDDIEMSDRLQQIVYSCATCKNCVESCGVPGIKDHLVEMVIAAREEMVNRGRIPKAVKDYFQTLYNWGNPFKVHQDDRGNWADGMDIPDYDGQEYLFYVGDAGSFDETGMAMARSVAGILHRAGVDFGILGSREISDGNEVLTLGERGLFDFLADETAALFQGLGVKKIITLSPHAFNSFTRYFPEEKRRYQVFHYTQVLATRVKELSLKSVEAPVTYHDSCYLGRWNGEYWSPRIVLKAVPGLDVREMDRSMANGLCCGGGGGNYFTDILGSGPDSAARKRVREAMSTGAEVLVTSCPVCAKMLTDGVKDEGAEDSMQVMDLAELVNRAL